MIRLLYLKSNNDKVQKISGDLLIKIFNSVKNNSDLFEPMKENFLVSTMDNLK